MENTEINNFDFYSYILRYKNFYFYVRNNEDSILTIYELKNFNNNYVDLKNLSFIGNITTWSSRPQKVRIWEVVAKYLNITNKNKKTNN